MKKIFSVLLIVALVFASTLPASAEVVNDNYEVVMDVGADSPSLTAVVSVANFNSPFSVGILETNVSSGFVLNDSKLPDIGNGTVVIINTNETLTKEPEIKSGNYLTHSVNRETNINENGGANDYEDLPLVVPLYSVLC